MNRTWQAFVVVVGILFIVTAPVGAYEANGVHIDWDGDTLDFDALGNNESASDESDVSAFGLNWNGGFLDLGAFGQQQQQGAAGQQQQQQPGAAGQQQQQQPGAAGQQQQQQQGAAGQQQQQQQGAVSESGSERDDSPETPTETSTDNSEESTRSEPALSVLYAGPLESDTNRTVTVTITDRSTGQVVFDETRELASGESVDFDEPIGEAGEYRIDARLDSGATASRNITTNEGGIADFRTYTVRIVGDQIEILMAER